MVSLKVMSTSRGPATATETTCGAISSASSTLTVSVSKYVRPVPPMSWVSTVIVSTGSVSKSKGRLVLSSQTRPFRLTLKSAPPERME